MSIYGDDDCKYLVYEEGTSKLDDAEKLGTEIAEKLKVELKNYE